MSDLRSTIDNAGSRRSKLPWIVGVVVLVLVAGIGWAVASSGGGAAEAAGSGEPVRGGTLEFALIDYQRSPDPQLGTNYAESIIANNVTDKLAWQDPDTGEITPWLAESWEVNDDLTAFTFHLRDDVTFSDGTPFDAEVVKANFDQYIQGDPALDINANGAPLFPGYAGTDVVDEHTVTIRFEAPLASALQAVSFTANAGPGFLAPSTLALSAEERTDPTKVIGTGPFVYESWEEQVSTVLVKREGYDWSPPALGHDGEAYLDRIVFNTIPEASVRTGSLVSGTLDATLDVGTTDEQPLEDQGFEIISRGVSGTAIFFNLNASIFPTNDIAVRRAIQLGWNREAVEQTVLTDSYSIATSVLAPSVRGYEDHSQTLRYDADEARRILDEAGWVEGSDGIREKDGRRLEVKLLGINNLVPNKPAYESVQQDLAEIGIDLQLTVVPIPDYTANVANAATEWNVVAANRSRNDPAALTLQYSPANGNGSYLGPDATGVDVDRVTEVLGAIETTLDPDERDAAAAAAQDLLLEEYALVNPIYNPSQVIAHADHVHGIVFDAQSRNHFVDTWKSNGE
ncbi:peptide/nickel transport system substrate-binding protein [Nocardioides zeae]|uniref:Peptide/nickel transport system substrate-binding protein n=2 Tax=Nocardioides zeae TaxID=1457234 RepID=A0ACC6INC8_9ACTN|nr:ABC transporter substrate-binding protein [Nocardioides zeae]MDQ1106566.1 peptide/nickel transport system substrate-binding protein [Nocardioides zeae]MDR6173754.1 peptide/nickel transport system substrate-binding protein [Nocardioides zeae]MDR6212216.1 peptide/nickel transport system substrate-binding protein [Nocardioides zeae]